MHQHPRNTSSSLSRPAQAAAVLFALGSCAWLWSGATAAADPHGQAPMKPVQLQDDDPADAPDDDQHSDDLRNARNPYVSGPLANIGGPSSGKGGQDLAQTLDNVLGDEQGDKIEQSIGDLMATGTQGAGADGIAQAVQGVLDKAQNGGADGIGQAIDGLVGSDGKSRGVIGSGFLGGSSADDGQSDGDNSETARKGLNRHHRAHSDTGDNSTPDSHATSGGQDEQNTRNDRDDEEDDEH